MKTTRYLDLWRTHTNPTMIGFRGFQLMCRDCGFITRAIQPCEVCGEIKTMEIVEVYG